MKDILRKIELDLRLAQNGPIVQSMEEKGVHYGRNFGVLIPQLRGIATGYKPDRELAEYLWSSDTREMNILATMLFPLEEITIENADRWGRSITNQEIREQACMNLFQNLPFADTLFLSWVEDSDKNIRATGYWLFARLSIIRSKLLQQQKINQIPHLAARELGNDFFPLRQAALNALKFYGRRSEECAQQVLQEAAFLKQSDNEVEREMFRQLQFEFDYY